jgi:hypothetical protein
VISDPHKEKFISCSLIKSENFPNSFEKRITLYSGSYMFLGKN